MGTVRRVLGCLWEPLARLLELRQRIVCSVTASLFVPAVVLLTFDSLVPFARPGEQPLYDPRGWSIVLRNPSAGSPSGSAVSGAAGDAQGGGSVTSPLLKIVLWTVRPGETISGIAERLGMNPDSLSSLNRPGGRGVHNLVVGERIRVPNQDGIELSVNGNLDALCRKYGLDVEEVLAVNGRVAADLRGPVSLFFPGVRFQGYERSLALGTSVVNPLPMGWQSSAFGRRVDPFTGDPRRHQGIDIAATAGSPVRSASDGTVTSVDYSDVLGNYVIIRDPLRRSLVYGHLERALVRSGQRVVTGERIGLVGATGRATGPHLHFEVRENGVPVNPRLYMPGGR